MFTSAYYDKNSDVLYFNLSAIDGQAEVKFYSGDSLLDTQTFDNNGEYSFHNPPFTNALRLEISDNSDTKEVEVILKSYSERTETIDHNREFDSQVTIENPKLESETQVDLPTIIAYDFNSEDGLEPLYTGGNRIVYNDGFFTQQVDELVSPLYIEQGATNLFDSLEVINGNFIGGKVKPSGQGTVTVKATALNAKSFQFFLTSNVQLDNKVELKTLENNVVINTQVFKMSDFFSVMELLQGTFDGEGGFEMEIFSFKGDQWSLNFQYEQITNLPFISSYTEGTRVADTISYSLETLNRMGLQNTDPFLAEIAYTKQDNTDCTLFKMGSLGVHYLNGDLVVEDGVNTASTTLSLKDYKSIRLDLDTNSFAIDLDDTEVLAGNALYIMDDLHFLSNGVDGQLNGQVHKIKVIK